MAKADSAAALKIKPGVKVRTVRPNGFDSGKVDKIVTTQSGEFAEVNFGDKRNPHMLRYRPSMLIRM